MILITYLSNFKVEFISYLFGFGKLVFMITNPK